MQDILEHFDPARAQWIEQISKAAKEADTHIFLMLPIAGGSLFRAASTPCSDCMACGNSRCLAFCQHLYRRAVNQGGPATERCPENGRSTAALPIFREKEAAAAWILCSFEYQDEAVQKEQKVYPLLNKPSLNLLWQILQATTLQALFSPEGRHGEQMDNWLELPGALQAEKDILASSGGTMLVLDILDLRKVNEAYGRAYGNQLLLAMREYLYSLNIPNSHLYRLETADFGLLVQNIDPVALMDVVHCILEQCAVPWMLEVNAEPKKVFFTVAIGLLSVDERVLENIAKMSGIVEYTIEQAAQNGGLAVFNKQRNNAFTRLIRLEMEMREAVQHTMRGFSVKYQPIIDPGNSLWKGVEALCRWDSLYVGPVSPEEFIPIAEKSGMINALGLWVMEKAITDMKALRLDEVDQFVLDVNVSPVQLADPTLDKKILAILEKHQYPLGKLCIEITESSEVTIENHVLELLERLSGKGVRVALDDFGVGYASVSSLYKLPVNVVKTDRSLVQGVEDNPFLQRVFYVMAEMAHACDMHIVAEGVETDAQLNTLLAEGADYIQGYRFYPPLRFEDIAAKRERFISSVTQKPTMEYSKVELEMPREGAGGFYLPPALFRVLNSCMQILFTNPDVDAAITKVLAVIGRAIRVSRATVFMRAKERGYRITHQWCAEGIKAGKDTLELLDVDILSPVWHQALKQDSMLVIADADGIEQGMRSLMQQYNMKAMAEFALWHDDDIVGIVCFEDCENPRRWTREEIRMLHTLGNMLAGALMRMELRTQTEKHNERLRAILDSIDAMIYVTKPQTGEILFANSCLLKVCGKEKMEGSVCWEALFMRSAPCEYCPVPKLLWEPYKTQQVQFFNTRMSEYMQASASLIPWEDGSMAALCCAFNISELKRKQMELEQSLFVDPLTRVMNRTGFNVAAQAMLEMVTREKKYATLVFLDVDGLKLENDLRGHKAGDELLCKVTGCLQKRLRKSDLIGRYGGDEFVLMLYNCRAQDAKKVLESALHELAEKDEPDIKKYHSFSYGIKSYNGAKSRDGGNALSALVDSADSRMLAFKKARRGGGRG